jgi:Group 4 capsule polysaccharide lipoprotein gfcB, YjbF
VTATGKLAAAVAVLALLVGCGNDKSGPNPVVAAIGGMAKSSMAKAKAKQAGGQAPASAPVTPADQRAKLEAGGKPVLLVAAAALGRTALLTVRDTKGDVLTWSADGATFSQRGGVLIQTRGLGADLMSAEAPSVGQLRSGASYQRIYYFLGPDDQGTRRTYDCTSSVVGPESIEIMARRHAPCDRGLRTPLGQGDERLLDRGNNDSAVAAICQQRRRLRRIPARDRLIPVAFRHGLVLERQTFIESYPFCAQLRVMFP